MLDTAGMAKMLQVRNIPERLHRELSKRAKARGQTLTEYVQRLLEREVARPPAEEVFDRIDRRKPIDMRADKEIRAVRKERESS